MLTSFTSLIKYIETQPITTGRIPTSIFDELLDNDIVHEIKHINIIPSNNKFKIIIGRSDPSQEIQRNSVGKVNFSFFSIIKVNTSYLFLHIVVKKSANSG